MAATFFLATWIGLSGTAWGQIVRVEEDWEIFIPEPDPDTDGPQFDPATNTILLNGDTGISAGVKDDLAPIIIPGLIPSDGSPTSEYIYSPVWLVK